MLRDWSTNRIEDELQTSPKVKSETEKKKYGNGYFVLAWEFLYCYTDQKQRL